MREGAGEGDSGREMGGSCANARGFERFADGWKYRLLLSIDVGCSMISIEFRT